MGRFFFALAAALFASACQPAARGPGAIDDARMIAAAREPENWLVNGGTFMGEHHSLLDQINVETVGDLKPAWSFDFDTTRSQEAEPIVVDGVMYVSTAWSKVYALDARTGRQIWFYDPQVPGDTGLKACCDVVNRGVAVYKGKVYVGTLDGRVVALDARDGSVVWSVHTTDPDGLYTITGAPRVAKNKVIIGNGGADFGVRGYVTAYDAETGAQAWRFYLVPGDPAAADNAASDSVMERLVRPTWTGTDYYRTGGGGTAWNAIMYDPELDRVYIGTGNGSPWNPRFRTEGRGDNLFLCSIVALDPDTGAYIWHYQENPQEAWDYNSSQPMILATLRIDGTARKVIMHAPKNGFFYVIDRTNGRVISAAPIVPDVTWASGIDLASGRPIEARNARYTEGTFVGRPGTAGAHNWHPMAYNPQTGLVYLSARISQTIWAPRDFYEHGVHGEFNVGAERRHQIGETFLLAWNPVTQREAWRAPLGVGGALSTAGNLVFQGRGTVVGEFVAFRADTGAEVWRQHTPNGIVAGAISYALDGGQYIAITTGAGGGGITGGAEARVRQPGRVLAFKLNGTGTLPPDPEFAPPANPSSERWAPARVAHGEAIYTNLCARCHGGRAVSSNVVPDLRRSAGVTDRSLWESVVLEGALRANGMPAWANVISANDANDVRGYISSRARELQRELALAAPVVARDSNGAAAGEQ